jgi:5'-nucleotidase
MEGALHGCRAVALSQSYGPETEDDPFAAARVHGAAIVRRLIDHAPWSNGHYGVFYNVNFPARAADQTRGPRATVQGHRPGPTFGVQPHRAPNGRQFLWLTHGTGNAGTAEGTDSRRSHGA